MRLIALGNYPWQTKPVNCPQVNSYCSHWVNSHLIKFPLGKFPPGECIFTNNFVFANGIFLASLEVFIFANYPM